MWALVQSSLPRVWPQSLKVKKVLFPTMFPTLVETTDGRTIPCEHRVTLMPEAAWEKPR